MFPKQGFQESRYADTFSLHKIYNIIYHKHNMVKFPEELHLMEGHMLICKWKLNAVAKLEYPQRLMYLIVIPGLSYFWTWQNI